MYHHTRNYSKTRSSEESSYTHTKSCSTNEDQKHSFWNNQPSCHLEDYIETDHSFKPEIHQLPLELYPNRPKIEVSKQERFERLIDNNLAKQEELYKIKIIKEQQEAQRYCTFQPNLSNDPSYNQQIFERLYEEGVEKQRQKEKVTPLISSQCTFHPKTNRANILNSEITNLEPIYIRFKQEIKKQLIRKQELRRKVEEEQAIKQTQFTVNQQSEKILQKKENFNKNVVDRLLTYMKETEYRNKVRIQEKEQKLNQQLTFAPEINPVTIQLPGQDFMQRQEILAEETKEKIAIKHYQIKKKECPFKPKVSVISDYLINIKRADETKEQKIERLYGEYQERKDNIERMREEQHRMYTFQPQISEISKQLEANHVSHCCGKPKQILYPHKPHLNQNSLKMAAAKTRASSVTSESKTDRIKMQLEYKQMKQCTFKPKTLTKVAKSQVSIENINGFQNFMRIKQLKSKQEEQQKIVEEKLFKMEKKYDQRAQKQTKIEGFKLSKSKKDVNYHLEEQLKRFHDSCPFKPNIGNKTKRGTVDKIIC